MGTIAIYNVKIHKTFDRKRLKKGFKNYDYGTINIRTSDLANYVGKTVNVTVKVNQEKLGKKSRSSWKTIK